MQLYRYASYLMMCIVQPCISTCCLIFLRGGGATRRRQAPEAASRGPSSSSGLPGSSWLSLPTSPELCPPRSTRLKRWSGFPGHPSPPLVCVPEAEDLSCSGSQSCGFLFLSLLFSLLWEDLLEELLCCRFRGLLRKTMSENDG